MRFHCTWKRRYGSFTARESGGESEKDQRKNVKHQGEILLSLPLSHGANDFNTYSLILYIQVTRTRVSKWDKPKETPPPPVNREVTDEDIHAAELPAAGISRNIAARYGHISLTLAPLESASSLIWEGVWKIWDMVPLALL